MVALINDIPKSTTHTYTLTMYYKETGKNQSKDMGKTLNAKINIKQLNPFNTNTLAYNIINNSKENKNGTKLVNHHTNFTKNANELSISTDNNGTSYYYRGKVSNNYLEFNNMCFRIVRIEGDGSIKITLAKEDRCNTITNTDTNSALINNGETTIFGYTLENNDYIYNYENYNGDLYTKLSNWYNTKMKSKESYLKAEEEMLSGEVVTNNGNYTYLSDNVNDWYWTLSMQTFSRYDDIGHDSVYIASGVLDYLEVDSNFYVNNGEEPIGIRPAITLKSGSILKSGDGTRNNPYTIIES